MRKPRNLWEFFVQLFLLLGVLFLLSGMLSRAGILKTDPDSHGDPGVVFPILGGALLAIGVFSALMAIGRKNKRTRLLESGMPVTGEIDAVKQIFWIKRGISHPYVVHFTYEWDGAVYQGKSDLFWSLPPLREHDRETVFVDEEHPKNCALKQ